MTSDRAIWVRDLGPSSRRYQKRLSHSQSLSKILNLMIAQLSYSHIRNVSGAFEKRAPGRGHGEVTLTLLSPRVCLPPPRCLIQMGTGESNAGGKPCNGLASHPGGSRNIPSHFMLQKPEISAGLMGHGLVYRLYPFL